MSLWAAWLNGAGNNSVAGSGNAVGAGLWPVEVAGVNALANPRAVRRMLGYVAQDVAIDKILTGRELLEFQGDLYHLQSSDRDARIQELVRRLGMNDWIDRRCGTYSGGMRRRLDLAAGLLHSPRLLVLDEPTVGLDIESRLRSGGCCANLSRMGQAFLSSHYLEEVRLWRIAWRLLMREPYC